MAPGLLYGQFDFHVDGKDVQVHSFASEGFAYSNQNNFLTMKTSDGASFTDYGVNVSTQLTDKLRVGAQTYGRSMGRLGAWMPSVDWAQADYRFKDWFGVRAGKVKSTLGLYNDTQDMGFLHTWALLPQSGYPADFRSDYIAHEGADIYGNIPVKKAGSFAYVVWGGKRPNDPNGGMKLALQDNAGGKIIMKDLKHAVVEGADLRWSTPLSGLLVGASMIATTFEVDGPYTLQPSGITADLSLDVKKSHTQAYYAQYAHGKLRVDAEYRRTWAIRQADITGPVTATQFITQDARYGYVSAAYRVSKLLEVGAYHSRFYPNWPVARSTDNGHVFDNAITARFDLRNYLDLKLEGHFMDGYGGVASLPRAFYPSDNPQGMKPTTNMFVVRLEYHL
jgi:hypothetical protein